MVLMAIDHVRVYSGVPAGGPTYGVFFTRWITHFCAPAFVFFAGTSAFFHGQRLNSRGALSRWLVTRGVWLVFLELTFLLLAWTFNVDFAHYMLLGVIWMLGVCMILMGALVYLPMPVVAGLGLAILAGHNLIKFKSDAAIWHILYGGGVFTLGHVEEPNIFVLYSILPWIGVMAAGYAFGAILTMSPVRRDRLCYAIGGGAIAAFLVLRYFNIYGDRVWKPIPNVPSLILFLNTQKYPASLLFLLMTLGPMIAALPLFERARGPVARWLLVFGRVPMFYYLLHIPLIHLVAVLVSLVRTPAATAWLFADHPMNPPPHPPGYMWSLGLLYLVFAGVAIALYFPCRWYADLKARRKSVWLSYL